jgi:D-inositol-3-phosphate glycosyltransferase
MKIAMVSERPMSAVLDLAAAESRSRRVVELAQALAADDHDVVMYVRRDDAGVPDTVDLGAGVAARALPAGPPEQLPVRDVLTHVPEFGENLAASLSRSPADIVHAHSWLAGIAALLARNDVAPVVHTFHGLGGPDRRTAQAARDTAAQAVRERSAPRGLDQPPDRVRLERAVCHDAAHVLADCLDQVGLLARMGTPRSKVTVVPGGVDPTVFRPGVPPLLPYQPGRLLCVGRVLGEHRFDTVVRALAELPDAELLIAGGPDADELGTDPEAQRLRSVAEQCQVSERIRLLGRVPHAEMPAVFASAEVVVCAPRQETSGLVSLEAAACGRPVVATAVSGLVDTVIDGVTGVVVPPNRHGALARAVRGLRADPIRLEGYGIAARDRAQVRHSWTRVARETANVYASVTAGAS